MGLPCIVAASPSPSLGPTSGYPDSDLSVLRFLGDRMRPGAGYPAPCQPAPRLAESTVGQVKSHMTVVG